MKVTLQTRTQSTQNKHKTNSAHFRQLWTPKQLRRQWSRGTHPIRPFRNYNTAAKFHDTVPTQEDKALHSLTWKVSQFVAKTPLSTSMMSIRQRSKPRRNCCPSARKPVPSSANTPPVSIIEIIRRFPTNIRHHHENITRSSLTQRHDLLDSSDSTHGYQRSAFWNNVHRLDTGDHTMTSSPRRLSPTPIKVARHESPSHLNSRITVTHSYTHKKKPLAIEQ